MALTRRGAQVVIRRSHQVGWQGDGGDDDEAEEVDGYGPIEQRGQGGAAEGARGADGADGRADHVHVAAAGQREPGGPAGDSVGRVQVEAVERREKSSLGRPPCCW